MSRDRATSNIVRGDGLVPLDIAGTPGYPQWPSHNSMVLNAESVGGGMHTDMLATDVARVSPRQHSPILAVES